MFTKYDLSFLKKALKSEIHSKEKGLEIYKGNETLINHCRDNIKFSKELIDKIELARNKAPY